MAGPLREISGQFSRISYSQSPNTYNTLSTPQGNTFSYIFTTSHTHRTPGHCTYTVFTQTLLGMHTAPRHKIHSCTPPSHTIYILRIPFIHAHNTHPYMPALPKETHFVLHSRIPYSLSSIPSEHISLPHFFLQALLIPIYC